MGAVVVLPADYAREHVELGYAATVHRAQGATVDTAHRLVQQASMTREAFYVGMTRGRRANTAYVATDSPDVEGHQHDPTAPVTARTVLTAVLKHVGSQSSAHETQAAEHERYRSIAQLAAEYDTIAAAAQRPRWARLLGDVGLNEAQVASVLGSDAYGPLAAVLRRAEADGHNSEQLLTSAVARYRLDDTDDIAAVLYHRVQNATMRPSHQRLRGSDRYIAGLIPEAIGPMTDAHRQALDGRKRLIENRADTLTETALRDKDRWLRRLGTPPDDPWRRREWKQRVRVLAAYRDRYQVTGESPLGPTPGFETARIDAARARTAMHQVQQMNDARSRPPGRSAPHISPPSL